MTPSGASPADPPSTVGPGTEPTARGLIHTLVVGCAALALAAASATGFDHVFVDDGWTAPVLRTTAVTVALVTVSTLLRLPWVISLATGVAGGMWWLTTWWPLTADVALSQRPQALQQGVVQLGEEIVTQVAPAPSLPGLVLLTATTCLVTAAIVSVLAHRGMPLTAIGAAVVVWAAPQAVPVPVDLSWTSTALMLAAAVVVLVTAPRNVTWSARGLTLATTAAATLAGLALAPVSPWYDSPALVDVRAIGRPGTAQPLVDVGDQLHLPTPHRVMIVRTSTPTYLRSAALGVFDGTTWRTGTTPGGSAQPADPVDATRLPQHPTGADDTSSAPRVEGTWSMTVQQLPSNLLPVPNGAVAVTGADPSVNIVYNPIGATVESSSVAALQEAAPNGPHYMTKASVLVPDRARLARVGVDETQVPAMTALPAGQEPLVSLAREVVTQAGASSPVDQVLAVQELFTGPDSEFVYSTDVPELRGTNALHTFVFDTRVGYCEYYATAMAVMLRGLGIPTRVATGYLPGTELSTATDDADGLYQVSSTDAHAWVEVAFDDHGWVVFDPTPRADTTALRPDRSGLAPLGTTDTTTQPAQQPTDALRPQTARPREPVDLPSVAPPALDGATSPASETTRLVQPGMLVAVAVAMAVGALLLRTRRRGASTDPTAQIHDARERLLRAGARLGVGRDDHETMTELTHRWRRDHGTDPVASQTVHTLADAVAFANMQPTHEHSNRMDDAVTVVRTQLQAAASRPRRVADKLVARLGR